MGVDGAGLAGRNSQIRVICANSAIGGANGRPLGNRDACRQASAGLGQSLVLICAVTGYCHVACGASREGRRQDLACEAAGQGRDAVEPATLAAQVRLFRPVILVGASQTAARSGALMKKHHALARRLRDRQDGYLRFTTDFRAPLDNNGSERDRRMAKLRQKVPECLRSLTGARQFCAIRSYLSTTAKHGLGVFGALIMLTKGQPWIPAA